jgi:hypothetical protein
MAVRMSPFGKCTQNDAFTPSTCRTTANRIRSTGVLVEDVYARDSKHPLRTSNRPLGHAELTVRDITSERPSIRSMRH